MNSAAGATIDKPSLREVRDALAVALAEADRLEELAEAEEAFRRGGVEGLYRDQGRTVADRVLALVEEARKSRPADARSAAEPEGLPGSVPLRGPAEPGLRDDADPLDDEEPE